MKASKDVMVRLRILVIYDTYLDRLVQSNRKAGAVFLNRVLSDSDPSIMRPYYSQ